MTSILWGNTVYRVMFSGEDLSHYSNKIEISWFNKMSVLSLPY